MLVCLNSEFNVLFSVVTVDFKSASQTYVFCSDRLNQRHNKEQLLVSLIRRLHKAAT
jgi:hypothetical protein